jgi:hypothetical protein
MAGQSQSVARIRVAEQSAVPPPVAAGQRFGKKFRKSRA